MINAFKIEFLKTKRSSIRKLLVLFPILVIAVIGVFFSSTGKIIPSVINQWGLVWASFYLSLIVGMIDREEKNSTQYKMILSTPYNLRQYELGRILNEILLYFFGTMVFLITINLFSLITEVDVSLLSMWESTIGIFLATLWEIPLYSWLSRLSNLYVSIFITLIGVLIEIITNNLKWGAMWPFTWPAIFTVPFTKLNINGTVLGANEKTEITWWIIFASLFLFIFLSYLAAISFRNQVKK